MAENELNQFRTVLTARVPEWEHFIRHCEGIAIEVSADQLKEIQAASERALAVRHLDREFNELGKVLVAPCRIEDSGFVRCQQCDEDINPKRLAATVGHILSTAPASRGPQSWRDSGASRNLLRRAA